MTVEIPEELASALNLSGRDAASAALEAIALEAFRERKLTKHQLRLLLGLPSRIALWEFFKEHQIETYTPEDLEHDLSVMKEV